MTPADVDTIRTRLEHATDLLLLARSSWARYALVVSDVPEVVESEDHAWRVSQFLAQIADIRGMLADVEIVVWFDGGGS